ncbi:MAG: hypothetical protein COA82_05780 [Alkaliphilus sp.]|nr:MAG: hypothetical protein COA82_05780 [Alkaliphilus sp.]
MRFLDRFTTTASNSAKTLSERTSDFIEVGKLNMKRRRIEDEIIEKYEEIGQYVYGRLKKSNNVSREELYQQLKHIERIEEKIKSLEKNLVEAKKIKYCRACDIELDDETRYCPICGKLI